MTTTHTPLLAALLSDETARICAEELFLDEEIISRARTHIYSVEPRAAENNEATADFAYRLGEVDRLSQMTDRKEGDNYWRLLVTTAGNIDVLMVLIARQLALLRLLKQGVSENCAVEIIREASLVYIPIAHKLGLYKVKSEMEDLCLKYTEHDAYYMIKEKLAATKRSRDEYVERFINPLKQRLEDAGMRFLIKGRTKSIHSIRQKMLKQQCEFEGIYDLFAIRIILQADKEADEKLLCWQAYSIVTDMYPPNTRRLRDWISVPKANGYESLHTTVRGPEDKWVEVQIRSERMDTIAERGIAAHWRYKGVHQGGMLDQWLASLSSLRHNTDGDSAKNAAESSVIVGQDKNVSSVWPTSEVYVLTPRGDVLSFPQGATILDFAYRIHSKVGNHCTGALINGRLVPVKERLSNGQQIDIITSTTQQPKHDWLNIVHTPRAKLKIKQALKELQAADSLLAKELIERRFKNRKIELNERIMAQVVAQLGFKGTMDFYRQVTDGKLDIAGVIDKYLAIAQKLGEHNANTTDTADKSLSKSISHEDIASYFHRTSAQGASDNKSPNADDGILIGAKVRGVDYSLARCCNPIFGDKVFGFLTSGGGVKIHRTDCPNATNLKQHYPYRIIHAQWGEESKTLFSVVLRVVGKDDITVVNNITHIITKNEHTTLRSINIDSHDGLFRGTFGIQIDDVNSLPSVMKKVQNVPGVKAVQRA